MSLDVDIALLGLVELDVVDVEVVVGDSALDDAGAPMGVPELAVEDEVTLLAA